MTNTGTTGTSASVEAPSSTQTNTANSGVYASAVFNNLPTSTYISLGTTKGIVQINNFYLLNPTVDDGGDVVIKQTQNYSIVYDPTDSSFWLGISSNPFATWQAAAEQDFMATLGISSSSACKLDVTSGVIYSPNNPLNGKSIPLSFCQNNGAFQ